MRFSLILMMKMLEMMEKMQRLDLTKSKVQATCINLIEPMREQIQVAERAVLQFCIA